jgi:transcriptional regulator with XRE-family HTH domain
MTGKSVSKKAVIAGRIRDSRVAAGLTQTYVAKNLGLHRPSVSEIEAGNRSVTAEELVRLAAMFDVDVAWLGGEGVDTVDPYDNKLQLAARELQKLKPDDLERLLKIIASMRPTGGA